jgi:hypothetical protein
MKPKTIGLTAAAVAVMVVAAGYLGLKLYSERQLRERISAALQKTPGVQAVRIGTMAVGLLGRGGEARQVEVDLRGVGTVTIDRVQVHDIAPGTPLPASLQLTAEGIRASGAAKAWPLLGQLGYTEPLADLACRYRFEPDGAALLIEELSLRVHDAAAVQFSGRFGGIDAGRLQAAARQPDQLLLLLPGVSVAGLSLHYTDHGLARRWLKQEADRQGLALEALTSAIVDELERQASRSRHQRTKELYAALGVFVRQPGTLSLTAAPEAPVTLLELFLAGGKPSDWIQRLRLQAARA